MINRARLEELTHVLTMMTRLGIAKEIFDMGFYLKRLSPRGENGCGYAGCAIGHAAMHPPFQNEGFRPVTTFREDSSPTIGLFEGDMMLSCGTGHAARLFFGLNDAQYFFLFEQSFYGKGSGGSFSVPLTEDLCEEDYIWPSLVVKRIEFLLEHPELDWFDSENEMRHIPL